VKSFRTEDSIVVVRRPGRFREVAQIFLFNWHFYAAALLFDVFVLLTLSRFSLQGWIRIPLCVSAGVATFWFLSSLLVSHYVYDRSELYRWDWLATLLPNQPVTWANIHAGLDQTSDALMRLFPVARPRVLDIYARSEMSEPSIRRARQCSQHRHPSETTSPKALVLRDGECDAVFLIFVAHELRLHEARLQFFYEISRALKPNGRVVLVEHLRDWKNFLAYGPGAGHFFSKREWLMVSSKAGFRVAQQTGITPFVRCFVFAKLNMDEQTTESFGVSGCG
jgi:hypothetical protein